MKVLMIVHIGETLGHLVRGLSIADALTSLGIEVEIATSNKGDWLISQWKHHYVHHKIRWDFSHNSCDSEGPTPAFLRHVADSNSDLLHLLDKNKSDLIISIPGIVTTQLARHLGIRHFSILHGPYLSPIVYLKNSSETELLVLAFARKIFYGNVVNSIFSHLADTFGFSKLTYKEYLHTEEIFVPQPGLSLPNLPNLHQVRFIRASFGPPFDLKGYNNLRKGCYITFGSGNPCDITRIVELASKVFPLVIVSTGKLNLKITSERIIARPFIASSSLVGRVGAVISHGGIGTVGTFAEFGTPQLIIPTELDQATMAVHAARMVIAKYCGLNSWAKRNKLGRRLPDFSEKELLDSLDILHHTPIDSKGIISSGSSDIASMIDRLIKHNNFEKRVLRGQESYEESYGIRS